MTFGGILTDSGRAEIERLRSDLAAKEREIDRWRNVTARKDTDDCAAGITELYWNWKRAEADAAALRAKAKTFPVIYKRNDVAGPTHIPWSVADMAYSVYSARYGKNQTLERMAERGGLYAEELDEFLPGWREQSSEVTQLRADIAALRALLKRWYGYYGGGMYGPASDYGRLNADTTRALGE